MATKKAVFHLVDDGMLPVEQGTKKSESMMIGPKITRVRPDVQAAPFKVQKDKTWLDERTENFVLVRDLISKSFKSGCIGIGPTESDATLRLGRALSSGMFGTVFEARVVVRDITVTVAVKIMVHQGYDDQSDKGDDESYVAERVSTAVREHETSHFLLFYKDGHCKEGYIPPDLEGYDNALQMQKWINTAVKYVDWSDAESLKSGDYENLDCYLRAIFERPDVLSEGDDVFLEELEEYLGDRFSDEKTVVMEPTPVSVPLTIYVMEKATYGIREFITIEDPAIVHDIVGQVFKASQDFYDITGSVHADMHTGNVMVLQRSSDIPEYVLVLIDFGRVTSSIISVHTEMTNMIVTFFQDLFAEASHAGLVTLSENITTLLEHTISDLDEWAKLWASLRPPLGTKAISPTVAQKGTQRTHVSSN